MSSASTPAPRDFERLEWCGQLDLNSYRSLYRCPACGAYFDLAIGSQYGQAGNSSYDSYTLARHRVHSAADLGDPDVRVRRDAAQLLTLDLSRARDFEELDRVLVRHVDSVVRLAALETLAGLVVGNYPPPVSLERDPAPDAVSPLPVTVDLSPLEPVLREILAEAPDIAKASARVLARHLLRHGRQPELLSLLETGKSAVQAGARSALVDAKDVRFTGSGADDGVRILMLQYVRSRAWREAAALLDGLGSRAPAATAVRDLARGAAGHPVGAFDLTPLVPTLLAASEAPSWLVGKEPYVTAEAALASLVESADSSVQTAALDALRNAARDGSVRAKQRDLASRFLMLHALRARAWSDAVALLTDPLLRTAAVIALRDAATGGTDVAIEGPLDLAPLVATLTSVVVSSDASTYEAREAAKLVLERTATTTQPSKRASKRQSKPR